MKFWIFILVGVISISVYGQAFDSGKVIDSVPISLGDDESFALYLPNSFNPEKLNSIVIVFDPGGRGPNGIKNFIPIAERFGHILVCSNNSKNGPYQQNFDIANRLFSKVFDEFNIDPKQIYLAGFSGGSRLATAIAVLTKQMSGVVACGAGFPENLAFAPTAPDFLYVGLVGDRDMNLLEMQNNFHFLQKLGFKNELILFEGGHIWPPPEVLQNAFEWIALNAHNQSVNKLRPDLLKEIYNTNYKELQNTPDVLRKSRELETLIKSFDGIYDVDSLGTQLNELKNSSKYESASKSQKEVFEMEERLILRLTDRFHSDYGNPKNLNKKWWSKELTKLKKLEEKNLLYDKMVSRLTYKLGELAYTRSKSEYFPVTPLQKNFCLFLLGEIRNLRNISG
ncbi:MAG: hypothetical protein R3213_07870 [Flavobacteriaceae bacterium]|nr:hypothetical protein [Flavobacteriaceae bacterium]